MIFISKFLPYGKQCIDQEDIDAVADVLSEDFITQGPKITEFEEEIAKYVGAKYGVAFNSGTSALHGAYFALGLDKGDEMITTPNTFVATANAGLYLGAKVNFCDVEKQTGNIDASKLEANENTKLITPVHYSGNPVNLKEIADIAEDNDARIIEDGAHALGAKYDGKKIGSLKYSEMAMFSFHPVKHITTGEGGIIVTNDEEYYERLQLFRSHGITKNNLVNPRDGDWYYEMQHLGFNYRITDIQCALGLSQLKKLDSFVENRRKIAEKYNLRAGMGMAFVQMGHLKRIFVIANELEEKGTFEEYVIINPKIISQSEELIYVGEGEGCLSVNREVEGIVPRHARITVEYYDYEGNKKTMPGR